MSPWLSIGNGHSLRNFPFLRGRMREISDDRDHGKSLDTPMRLSYISPPFFFENLRK